MENFLKLILAISLAAVLTSCSKDGDSNFQSRTKLDAKPQVKDVLKGKSKAEILKMKYKNLSAGCTLETQKITKGQFFLESSGNSPAPPPVTDNPVSNPNDNALTYDLKLQQLVDRELIKDVNSKITTSKDGQTLNIDITFKPIIFQEALNIDFNKKKYILKHSPVLSYVADYQLLRADPSIIVGKTQGKIYEKIADQKNEVIAIEIGTDKYNFILDCRLERAINPENVSLAAEFDNQWIEIDCLAPKNDEERAVCK